MHIKVLFQMLYFNAHISYSLYISNSLCLNAANIQINVKATQFNRKLIIYHKKLHCSTFKQLEMDQKYIFESTCVFS